MIVKDLPVEDTSAIRATLTDAVKAKLDWAIAGPSGAGKTQIIESLVSSWDREVKSGSPDFALYGDINGVVMMRVMIPQWDEYTLRGIQTFKESRDGEFQSLTATPQWAVEYAELREANPDALIVLFLDELAVGSQALQASLLQLLGEKRVGMFKLEGPVTFVAAYNRAEDGASFFNMSAPLARRFGGHTAINPSVEEWRMWAIGDGVLVPEVDHYLEHFPGDFIAGREGGTKLAANDISPRGWEFACRMITQWKASRRAAGEVSTGSEDGQRLISRLQARMSSEIAVKFLTSVNIAGQLPTWKQIHADPFSVELPTSLPLEAISIRNCLTCLGKEEFVDSFLVYVNRLSPAARAAAESYVTKINEATPIAGLMQIAIVLSDSALATVGGSTAPVSQQANRTVEAAAERVKARMQRELARGSDKKVKAKTKAPEAPAADDFEFDFDE